MLIYIDPSLIDYFKNVAVNEKDIEALENIIISHRYGYHYINSDRKSLEFLSEMPQLSVSLKRQINMLNHEYTTLGNLSERISSKIIVKPPGTKMRRNDTNNESSIENYRYTTSIFEIPLDYFNKGEILYKTRLLAENSEDCSFFKFIGEEFSRTNSLPFHLSFDPLSGGGNQTYKELKQKLDNDCVIFVLVDSDKKNPEACLGKTSELVLKVFEQNNANKVIGCEVLPVHEKENLLSSMIYKHVGNNVDPHAIEQLAILEKNDLEYNFFRYLDIKEGLHSDNYTHHFESIFNIPNLIPQLNEHSRGFKEEFVGSKEEFLQYSENQKSTEKAKRVKKYLIQKLGANPLNNFNLIEDRESLRKEVGEHSARIPEEILLQKIEKLKVLDNMLSYLLKFQKEYFLILGMQIYEWGLANPKRTA